jgi:hypothetical protein
MTYLPPGILEEAPFPKTWDKDLRLQVRMIVEKWTRMFPAADYFTLKKAVTKDATSQHAPVGAVGTTKFDPVYGETVDSAMGSNWVQPHLSGTVKAANVDLFDSPVKIPRRTQRTAKELELKRWGFDKVRTMIVTIPSYFFDLHGITVVAGDNLAWNGERFTVLQFNGDGYWKNSNVPLYLILNVEHARVGS